MISHLIPPLLLLSASLAAATDPAIEKLISQMSLEEKFGQIQQLPDAGGDPNNPFLSTPGQGKREQQIREGKIGSILNAKPERIRKLQKIATKESRLKIPLLFGNDVIHGYTTTFMVPLGEAASWDPDTCQATAAAAADEAAAVGIRWTFAPMVDIARDPRWGRVVEGAGEDPFLGSRIAEARVKGFQHSGQFAACAKHWAAYGAAEAGRDYNIADISERTLREIYFPPFKAALDAGVLTFMTSFNEVAGVPATANRFLLTSVLRGEWHFPGFVVSDSNAVHELIEHGIAANGKEAGYKALTAGCDMEMASTDLAASGPELVASGQLPIGVVNEAVRRILTVKKHLGLFENPYTLPTDGNIHQKARDLARKSAARSIVLLKNEHGTLPIPAQTASIAVLGPLADAAGDMVGPWAGDRTSGAISLLAALKKQMPCAKITYVKGCEVLGSAPLETEKVKAATAAADFVIVAIGEHKNMSGEAHSRSNIGLPGRQTELVQLVHATGKPYAVVLCNGRPLTLGWIAENSPAILETWFAGSEAGNAITDILLGTVNPGAKLPVSFPRALGQVPIYYNHKNTGRPVSLRNNYVSKYIDVPNTPQYPFGYGLSYTRFEITPPTLSTTHLAAGTPLTVTTRVTNTGKREGDEVVQLYLHDKTASVTRPVRELKGFKRVSLKPGQTQNVTFTLGPAELGFLGLELKWTLEPGDFEVFVGNSSLCTAKAEFTLEP